MRSSGRQRVMAMARRAAWAACAVYAAAAWGQSTERTPHIGYLYPAGGRQGATIEIMAGGQFIRDASKIYVSGGGVSARVVRSVRPLRPLNKTQLMTLMALMNGKPLAQAANLSSQSRELSSGKKAAVGTGAGKAGAAKAPAAPNADKSSASKGKGTSPLDDPLYKDLATLSREELALMSSRFLRQDRKQPNAQIGETVFIEVTIDPNAAPGEREVRLATSQGLTNPLRFQVGQLPEVCEREPIGRQPLDTAAVNLPVVLNGQITPGDTDSFRFRARKGQRLVIEAAARRLMPYLADAVPGWFQAVLALRDGHGKEVAFSDDYRFDPDPVLLYEAPEDGEYELEIRDSIYRGREDFVYRVTVGEQPFITQVFPLGGRKGVATVASIDGWNLPGNQMPLDTQPIGYGIRWTAARQGDQPSNLVPYAVNDLPECEEAEPNDEAFKAQRIGLPRIINGRIGQPGDVDAFRFEGHAGEQVVAEVYARRLNSPLDSLLRLTNASGQVVQWNDDREDKETGLLTHHADSYLLAKLPADGVYCVFVSDTQSQGGQAYGYRLRLSPPQPDFALRVTPSGINARAGRPVALCVYAVRKDGFDGDIKIALKDAPEGFILDGGRIPAGRDSVRMTLTATGKSSGQPVILEMDGRAVIDGKTVSRPAVAAEDMMQAFAYRHLVPTRQLVATVMSSGRSAPVLVEITNNGPVRIPAGGTATVRLTTSKTWMLQGLHLELSEPPKGISLQDVTANSRNLTFTLKADGETAKPGLADNLIVQAFTTGIPNSGKGGKTEQRYPIGVLPAIPFEIVQR